MEQTPQSIINSLLGGAPAALGGSLVKSGVRPT